MKALILAGGLATRLRPLTDAVPKSLLPVANRPFLEHQVRLLAAHGVDQATLLTGHLAAAFDEFVARARGFGVALDVSTEQTPLGTAGAVRSVLDRLEGPTLVFNGDVLTALDLSAMISAHRERGAAVTIALARVEDSDTYGVVPLDGDERVLEFRQMPKTGHPQPPAWINAGTYLLEPKVLAQVPPETAWSFETQLFPSLLESGEALLGFRSEAYWIDIGTPARYLQAHFDILEGRAPFKVDGRLLNAAQSLTDGTEIVPPVLLSHALVEPGARIGPLACLGVGSEIGEGAVVERSVIHAGAEVGARAVVRESILGEGARVLPGEQVEERVLA